MNSHDWYGILSNFHKDINDNLTFDLGIDARTYKGYHYRIVNDVLGADGYMDNSDVNNPDRMITEYYEVNPNWNPFIDITGQQKIVYYNTGSVRWYGGFGQLEYKNDALSTFLQFGVSQQGFQRTDFFGLPDDDNTSKWQNILGGDVKGGLNYNINEKNNVFFNAGYYSKQPNFDAVFPNHKNNVNEDLTNETIIGLELGYGFKSERANFNLNLYRTTWDDRFVIFKYKVDGDTFYGWLNHVNEMHMGVEAELSYRPVDQLKLMAMASLGDWVYSGNPKGNSFDEDNNPSGEIELFLDGAKVGDAAQFTSRLGMEWKAFKNFSLDLSQFFADELYADMDFETFKEENNEGSLKLPSYSLTDAGMSYKFNLTDKMKLKLRLNVNNVFDHLYISESDSNVHAQEGDETWRGINTSNNVYFGFGRTWNFGVRFTF